MQLAIVVLFIGFYIFDLIVELLNISSLSLLIPKQFAKVYDQARYKKSQNYLRETSIFELIVSGINLIVFILFLTLGGFGFIETIAKSSSGNQIIQGFIFVGILTLSSEVLSLPFSIYQTFVIEHEYGFNKTTMRIFVSDEIKKLVIGAILGGIVLASLIYFFESFGLYAWIIAWVFIAAFEFLIVFIAPVILMPLFNKFEPLGDEVLKRKIEKFAESQKFAVRGIFVMDASKRSTKSNAFFTGFGKYRRIVFFDTLLKNHTDEEILSVLAHEIGHYKKYHTIKLISVSLALSGIFLFLVQLIMGSSILFEGFGFSSLTVYGGLVMVGLLATPLSAIAQVLINALSRRYEYQADEFAIKKYGEKKAFISALKKLSRDNLSNLTPHPLKVIVDYTHPPILARIKAIEQL